jgi:hypothetical protein
MLRAMTSSINFRRADLVRDIRELAALKGVTLTKAVRDAVLAELSAMGRPTSDPERRPNDDRRS